MIPKPITYYEGRIYLAEKVLFMCLSIPDLHKYINALKEGGVF